MQLGQADATARVHRAAHVDGHVAGGTHVADGRVVRVRVHQVDLDGDVVFAALEAHWDRARECEQLACLTCWEHVELA